MALNLKTSLVIFVLVSYFQYGICITNVPTKIACESYTMYINCPEGEEIQILEANYGRTSSGTCPHSNDVHRNCYARGSLERVKERCNGKYDCQVQASNVFFGDPCPGTAKYLSVLYRCISMDDKNVLQLYSNSRLIRSLTKNIPLTLQ